jgi:thioredoxin-related protein
MRFRCLCLCLAYTFPCWLYATTIDTLNDFDDVPLAEDLLLPDWFKVSFLELEDDMSEAINAGKKGLIIYFGQKRCPYCKAQLENNWGQKDIRAKTQANFDVIAIDIRSQKQVTDFDGKVMTEKEFSIQHDTNFTPSLLFFVKGNVLALKLRGYRPPYQFRAALEYVIDEHYKREAFSQYLARAEAAFSFGKDELNNHKLTMPPPYALNRSRFAATRPLVVMFEQRNCHACDVLHAGPLSDPRIHQHLENMDLVQLDVHADTPVITPSGEKTTAKDWAKKLNLDYAPTLIFFDFNGKEIIRIDSVVWFYRLRNVLTYIETEGYKIYPTFQSWRQQKKR